MPDRTLLAVDIGNTNIVFGLYKGRVLTKIFRIETKGNRRSSEYIPLVKKHISANFAKNIGDIIVCSVVPQTKVQFTKFCNSYFGKTPFDVGDNIGKLGIKIKIADPKEVGADRVVNAIAYFYKYKKAGVVLDFGTATTFDVVSAKGEYLGGAISPGVNLAVAALSAAAAKLPKITLSKPKKVIGNSTLSAMQSGIYFGYLGLVEGIIKEITSELGKKPYTVATGGLAVYFGKSSAIDSIEENLTLDGLFIINERRKK